MKTKAWGGFLLAAMTLLSAPLSAGATTTTIGANSDSPTQIMVTREVTGVSNPVTANFQYTITEDDGNPGRVNNLPSTMSINLNAVEPTENAVYGFGWLDFSNVEFDTLGDYKFIVREVASSEPTIYPVDSSDVYYVYAYVRNEVQNGAPTGNLIATLVLQAKNGDVGEKGGIVFTSQAGMTYIEISKTVTGNIADTNEYFKFTLNFDDAEIGDRYTITGQDASIVYNGETITTSSEYVAGSENVIYLKHGQTATIGVSGYLYQLPIGARYSVSEVDDGRYTISVNGEQGNSVSLRQMEALHDGGLAAANKVSFVNHRESEVLTGVTMAIIPFAIVATIGVTGYVISRKLRKNEDK